MKDYPFIITKDEKGVVEAVVTIEGKEYTVEVFSIGLPTEDRNKLIRYKAAKMAKEGLSL